LKCSSISANIAVAIFRVCLGRGVVLGSPNKDLAVGVEWEVVLLGAAAQFKPWPLLAIEAFKILFRLEVGFLS
jgi:hypothetical protein